MKTPFEPSEHRLQQIRKLTEVSRALTYAASLDEVFQLTVDRAADLLLGGEVAPHGRERRWSAGGALVARRRRRHWLSAFTSR